MSRLLIENVPCPSFAWRAIGTTSKSQIHWPQPRDNTYRRRRQSHNGQTYYLWKGENHCNGAYSKDTDHVPKWCKRWKWARDWLPNFSNRQKTEEFEVKHAIKSIVLSIKKRFYSCFLRTEAMHSCILSATNIECYIAQRIRRATLWLVLWALRICGCTDSRNGKERTSNHENRYSLRCKIRHRNVPFKTLCLENYSEEVRQHLLMAEMAIPWGFNG